MLKRFRSQTRCLLAAAFAAGLWGCAGSGGGDDLSARLQREVLGTYRDQTVPIRAAHEVQLRRSESDVDEALTVERLADLDRISGEQAYRDRPLELGDDLLDQPEPPTRPMRLQEAIALAVEHNLDLQTARLTPAIARAQLTQAQAVFDATFFTDASFSKLDTPRPGGNIPGLVDNQQSEVFTVTSGIRKPLETGGELDLSATLTRNEQTPTVLGVPAFYDADLSLTLRQSLLRGFGPDVNRAQIVLAESARRVEVERLRSRLLTLMADVESAYWDLFRAQRVLKIQWRLLERTIDDRDRLVKRAQFDVSPVRVTEANSFVELRRAEVIRARQDVRVASDRLKRLVNAPDLPVADETLIDPADNPVEQPIVFNLLDAVVTAIRDRPELRIALADIDDASVRQRAADNARLPLLDIAATITYNGLDIDQGTAALDNLTEGDFIDYILALQFEMPIGNRQAEALFRQRELEREVAATNYRSVVQGVVLEVKTALRNLVTQYELIGANRAARRAAADNLRAIEEQEAAGVALTPEFLLDLKLQSQQRLATAEIDEVSAVADYNASIAELYRVMGTLLDRNGIAFAPDAEE